MGTLNWLNKDFDNLGYVFAQKRVCETDKLCCVKMTKQTKVNQSIAITN